MVETEVLFRMADAAEEAGDFDRVRELFERGAALGDISSITRLAYMHDLGLGIPTDKAAAMRLYRHAWRRSSSTVAATNIAILYREQANRRAMFKWFHRAAKAGDGSAQFEIAKCYLGGIGVRKSVQSGLRSLSAAIDSIYITEAEREEAAELKLAFTPRSI